MERVRIGDDYRIERELASGGFGTVYLATQLSLDRYVCVKRIHPHMLGSGELDTVSMFLDEARLVAKLRHENVCRVIDCLRDAEGVPIIVMEYIEGCDVHSLLERHGPLPWRTVGYILVEVLKALTEAHEPDPSTARPALIHRDIKPSNIMLGNNGSVVVVDFGIARAVEDSAGLNYTNNYKGSLAYAAPEQLRLGTPFDRRVDLWQLGVTAWEMLSGCMKRPFEDETFVPRGNADRQGWVVRNIIEHRRRPISEAFAHLPPEADALLEVIDALLQPAESRPRETYDVLERLVHAGLGLVTERRAVTELVQAIRPPGPRTLRDFANPLLRGEEPASGLPSREGSERAPRSAADGSPSPAVPAGDAPDSERRVLPSPDAPPVTVERTAVMPLARRAPDYAPLAAHEEAGSFHPPHSQGGAVPPSAASSASTSSSENLGVSVRSAEPGSSSKLILILLAAVVLVVVGGITVTAAFVLGADLITGSEVARNHPERPKTTAGDPSEPADSPSAGLHAAAPVETSTDAAEASLENAGAENAGAGADGAENVGAENAETTGAGADDSTDERSTESAGAPLAERPEARADEPSAAPCRFHVVVVPEGRVVVDGVARGAAPRTVVVDPGEHVIVGLGTHGGRAQRRVQCTDGERRRIAFDFL